MHWNLLYNSQVIRLHTTEEGVAKKLWSIWVISYSYFNKENTLTQEKKILLLFLLL